MATYNGAMYVKEQIDSILSQLAVDDELLISDDASTDDTVQIIADIQDSRIRFLGSQHFGSPVLNFERVLREARGQYIFLADQDDVWAPNKVVRMLEELQSADLVVSDCTFIDGAGKVIGESYFKAYKSGEGVLKNFVKNTYLGNCIAFRQSVLFKSLPFPPSLYKASKFALYHDVWIGMVANIWFRVRFIPDKLSAYRRHSANASPTEMNAKSPNSFIKKIKSRYLLATGLVGRLLRFS
ncbi:glycosyltransferase family 2 protein [Fibrella rubiginis]